MKFALIALAAPFLISASEAVTETASNCSHAITKEKQQKAELLDALERYKSCIGDDRSPSICLDGYDKMSVIYSSYRNSTLDFVQGCYLTEH